MKLSTAIDLARDQQTLQVLSVKSVRKVNFCFNVMTDQRSFFLSSKILGSQNSSATGRTITEKVQVLRFVKFSYNFGLLTVYQSSFILTGWKPVWAVLERGVLHYFNTRAEAANLNDSRRRDYKYLDSARVTASKENPLSFFIHVSCGLLLYANGQFIARFLIVQRWNFASVKCY